jgi:DNA polymerase-1
MKKDNDFMCDNLFLDSYNLIHRSRFDWGGGLAVGEAQIIYNFLKSIKPILEKFDPKKVYFVLDGAPKARLEADSEYKANRKQESLTPEEEAYWTSFHKQKRTIINLAKELLPFTTVYHPDFECDDILAYLATKTEGNNVIVSSDTDFIQALDLSDKVRLWNPVSQQYRERLDVDYTKYKAMVGDKTDNIPGVKGIGKVGAIKILKDETLLAQKMSIATFREQFEHSYRLVKFEDIGSIKDQLQYYQGFFSEEELEVLFEKLDFKSMLVENYFDKYVEVMERLS